MRGSWSWTRLLCLSCLILFIISTAALAQAGPPGKTASSNVQQAAATFDDGGRGFVIGFGAGYARTDWGVDHAGVFTSFKIGYAPSSRFAILWQSSGTFFKGTDGNLKMDGIGGGTIHVYMSARHARSLYVLGGAGYHNIVRLDALEGTGSNSIGFGIRGGGGFQFSRHWALEGVVQRGFNAVEHDPFSFGITLNFINR